jgi:hypothetical protein
MVEMYVKIKLISDKTKVEYCFMKGNVEVKEIQEKVNELKLKFDKDEVIKMSIGY